MNEKERVFIQDQIGYNFKNVSLLEQAFTRKSYTEEYGGENNEVLEFIGDKVLDYVVVKMLVEDYCSIDGETGECISERSESELTDMKRRLVERYALADRVDHLNIARYLKMSKSDCNSGANQKDSVKEDLFEAIMGAVALDTEWDTKELTEVFKTMHEPDSYLFDEERDNYVALVQEWAAWKENTEPLYHYDKNTTYLGYSNEPRVNGKLIKQNLPLGCFPRYYCLMKLGNLGTFFIGYGDSCSEARRNTCKLAYEYLKSENLLFTIKDEIENPNEQQAINQLETLSRRGYFPIPEYDFEETYDKNGNPVWKCTCSVKGIKTLDFDCSSSKKEAKKKAAFKMLNYVLENYEED